MSQSLVKNLVHLLYSTKGRQRSIVRDDWKELYAYQAEVFKDWVGLTVMAPLQGSIELCGTLPRATPLLFYRSRRVVLAELEIWARMPLEKLE